MYRCNASMITTPTVRPSATARAFAASHSSSGTRTARTGVPFVGTSGPLEAVVPQDDAARFEFAGARLARQEPLIGDELFGRRVVEDAGDGLAVVGLHRCITARRITPCQEVAA